MSNVQFEEDTIGIQQMRTISQAPTGAVVSFFMKMGIIKDESKSKGVLLGIVVINLIATALVIYYFI